MPSSTRSCLLYAGRTSEQPASESGADAFAAIPFWVRCISHFHLFDLTTRQTQIPRVSIGCKISPIIRLWLTEAGTLPAGFTPRRVPLADACRLIFAPLLRRGLPWQSLVPLKGTPRRDRSVWQPSLDAFVDILIPSRTLGAMPILVVIFPQRSGKKMNIFFSTDITLDPARLLELYGARFQI